MTGFEPFGGSEINPSILACKDFNNKIIMDYRIKTYEIPLRFSEIKNKIETIVEENKPSIVICTGQSPRATISIERVAINIADIKKSAYNCGAVPKDEILEQRAPAGYFSTLPIKEIQKNLEENLIPIEISNSAGTYGCNQIFYHLMHFINMNEYNIPAGFIHVPSLPEQVVGKIIPSMSLDLIKKALTIILNTVIENLESKK